MPSARPSLGSHSVGVHSWFPSTGTLSGHASVGLLQQPGSDTEIMPPAPHPPSAPQKKENETHFGSVGTIPVSPVVHRRREDLRSFWWIV